MDVSVANYPGADNIATNQVSVTSAATAIVAARATRRSVLIINHGTTNVYIGGASVTTSDGILLTGTAGAAIGIGSRKRDGIFRGRILHALDEIGGRGHPEYQAGHPGHVPAG